METIRKRGTDVSVTGSDVPNEIATKELIAVAGSTTVRRRITLAAIDGANRPTKSISELQVQYDSEKNVVAEEAAFREEMTILASQLT